MVLGAAARPALYMSSTATTPAVTPPSLSSVKDSPSSSQPPRTTPTELSRYTVEPADAGMPSSEAMSSRLALASRRPTHGA